MTELRVALSKVLERYGLDPVIAASVAHRIKEVDIEPVHLVLNKHAPATGQPMMAVVQPEKPELWDPVANSRKNIASVIAHGDWVLVTITKQEQKKNEPRTNLWGVCTYKDAEYDFKDSENADVPNGKELLDYLISGLRISKPSDFVGRKVWAQFVDKGQPLKKVGQFMTVEEYAVRNPAA